ncbi:MAG: DUF748 domain-containing protein [Desulfobacteraceae bacterium]|nr:DUF748 domain-containing protein [Desulfobacteraceae bacterium]
MLPKQLLPPFRRKLLYAIAGILLIYAIAGFVVVPMVAEKKLPEIAASAINGQVTVRDIDFNPFFFSASVHGLDVAQESGQTVLSAERVSANVELSSVFKKGPVIRSVEIQGPKIDLVRHENGDFNFADLLVKKQQPDSEQGAQKPDDQAAGSQIYFLVEKFRIRDGQIRFLDESNGFETIAESVFLGVDRLGNKTDRPAAFELSVKTRAGEEIDCTGEFGLFPVAAEARIDLKNADIKKYAPFYQAHTGLAVKSGRVDVSAEVRWPQQASSSETGSLVSNGKIRVRSLSVLDPQSGNAVFDIPVFTLSGIDADLAGKSVSAKSISTSGGTILAERTAAGRINFSRITAGAPAAGDNGDAPERENPEPSGKQTPEQAAEPWNIRLDTISISDYTLAYSDLVPENPVSFKIRRTNVRLYDFTLQKDSPSYWSVSSLAEQGAISAQGRIQLTPLMAELDFKVTDIGLDTADPYAAPFGMNIEKGTLNVAGSIEAEETSDGLSGNYIGDLWIDDLAVTGIKAGPLEMNIQEGSLELASRFEGQTTPDGFTGSYTGDFRVDDLGLKGIKSDSLGIDVTKGSLDLGGEITAELKPDKISGTYAGDLGIDDFTVRDVKSGESFLRFAHLGVEDIQAGSDPMAFQSGRVILRSPEISMTRDEQGNLTPALLAGSDKKSGAGQKPDKSAPKQDQQESKTPLELAIAEIKIENGLFSFTDRFIDPAFSTRLNALDLRISDFLLDRQSVAPFELSGRLENQAPFTIKGEIRTLDPTARTGVDIAFSNIGMPLFTPYSGKYVGYEIQKGKLNLELDYRIDARKLKAENHLVFNQFYLGQSVQSPDAPNLPLKLALALLRDRSGNISLDVPVEGDMSSPEFKLGGVIYSAFINLLKRIATSPFAALSSLVPNAEKLKYVDFAPAEAQLDEQGRKKLDNLETALYKRPGLQLLIRPGTDPQKDREAFKQKAMEELVEAEKTGSADPRLTPEQEYEKYLKAACKTADIDTDDLSVAEMEAALKQTIEIPEQRLTELARLRGKTVRDYLLEKGRIKAERIFLENPQMADNPRVEFELEAK